MRTGDDESLLVSYAVELAAAVNKKEEKKQALAFVAEGGLVHLKGMRV